MARDSDVCDASHAGCGQLCHVQKYQQQKQCACIFHRTVKQTDGQTRRTYINKAIVAVRLDPDDAGHLARDRHGPGTMASRHRTRAADTTTYDGDVLLGGICAAFSLVEHLLALAVLVHRNCYHFLLSITRHLALSVHTEHVCLTTICKGSYDIVRHRCR